MEGVLALAGGDEFRPMYDGPDRTLLELLPRRHKTIIIIPTAAGQQHPEAAIAHGVRHFQQLAPRAAVEGAPVVDAATANDPAMARRIAAADIVYLTGGDPGWLARALRGSEALAAIAAVAARGGIVAGSSAGAMALGAVMRWGSGWEPGFAFARKVVVIPHHSSKPSPLATTRAGLPDTMTVLGIPAGTVCVRVAEDAAGSSPWRVLGDAPVTVYHADRIEQVQADGQFLLRLE